MTGPTPRPEVAAMHAYVPGEQPKDARLVKLNTNENNYPPSPKVLEALAALGERRIARYPDPVCGALRESIARTLAVGPSQVVVGNGSDEVLKMAAEAYVSPGERVGCLWPTYSLYPVFVQKAAATEVRFPWSLDGPTQEEALEAAPADLALAYLTTPNPPFGLPLDLDAVRRFALRRPQTLVVSDEAYIAYGGKSALELVREGLPNVLVTRSFSKSHSLAGMRVGFAVGSAEIVAVLNKVKDSYNLNATAQAAAQAAWEDQAHTDAVVARIVAARERTAERLRGLGFQVPPSAGNFLFALREDAPALFPKFRDHNILVRWFDTPGLRNGLRVSIGTDDEMETFLRAAEALCSQ